MQCIHATLTLFLRCPELGHLDVLSRHNSFAGAVTAGAASVVFLETQVCIGLCAKRLEGFYNQLRLGNCRPTLYSISYMLLGPQWPASPFESARELQMTRCLGLGCPDPIVELC